MGAALSLSFPLLPSPTEAADTKFFSSNKSYDDLTPAEKTAAKALARTEKLNALRVCADPGNMPLSDQKGQGYENKIVEVLAKAMDTELVYFWRPYQERGLTSQTFDSGDCDVLLDVPADFERVLTTVPIYRTTYVFAYRTDSGLSITSMDDPRLKTLRVGVFQQSGIRQALADHGVIDNLKIHIISYDADLEPETQPWRQVQEVVDGKLDIAGVWGPFAGYVLKQGAPLTLVPVNRMEDKVQLEFDLAMGVRKNDVVLKYKLDNALENSKDEIAKILNDYGVPLVQCSRCVVSGDIPSHGSYFTDRQGARPRHLPEAASAKPDADRCVQGDARPDRHHRARRGLAERRLRSQRRAGQCRGRLRSRAGRLPARQGRRHQQAEPARARPAAHRCALARFRHGRVPLEQGRRRLTAATPMAGRRSCMPPSATTCRRSRRWSLPADVDAAAPGGYTALAIALAEGKFFAAKALLDAGAKVDTLAGAEQLTPLMLVASQPLVERRAANIIQGPSSVDIGKAADRQGRRRERQERERRDGADGRGGS